MSARTPAPPPGRALLVRMSRLPRLLVPGIVLLLTFTGLAAPAWVGAPCLVLVAAFLGWLAALSWPVLDSRGRTLRVLTIGLLVAAIVARLYGLL